MNSHWLDYLFSQKIVMKRLVSVVMKRIFLVCRIE